MRVVRPLDAAEPVRVEAGLNAALSLPQRDAARCLAAGLQYAIRAKQANALIVAVAGAPGVVQLRKRAAAHPQHQNGSIDIVEFSNFRQRQRIPHGGDGCHFIAGKKTQQIEKVDRLVAHLAAGAAQIFQRRHNRCPTHHLHQFDFANHPGLDLAAQLLVAGVKAAVKANGHRYP